jgi:hypothetical protein
MIHGFVVMAHYQEALHRKGVIIPDGYLKGYLADTVSRGPPPGYRERRIEGKRDPGELERTGSAGCPACNSIDTDVTGGLKKQNGKTREPGPWLRGMPQKIGIPPYIPE